MKCAECGIELLNWDEVKGTRDGPLGGLLCGECQDRRKQQKTEELKKRDEERLRKLGIGAGGLKT